MNKKKTKLKDFLNGKLDLDDFQEVENDFIDSYRKVIEQLHGKEGDNFNPFEKIEALKKYKITLVKRMLPYAASLLMIFSIYFIYESSHSISNKTVTNEAKMKDLKRKTESALLCFSKELNVCLKEIKATGKTNIKKSETVILQDIEIEFYNPIKNLKIN